jgi:hypothetical protein
MPRRLNETKQNKSMSEKVLKIAGRRPMLLALIIMATIATGMLFSGWLAPAPVRAQPGQPDPDRVSKPPTA